MVNKLELVVYSNEYLKISDFDDTSKNGLQVDNQKDEIKKIWYAVDANSYIFDKAIKDWEKSWEEIDMIISHHGMYRWFESTMTWLHYERIKKLIENNISLYACHLPLDAHQQVGNNIGLLKAFLNMFGMKEWEYNIEKFWWYHDWREIWYGLKFKNKVHVSNVLTPYAEQLWLIKKLYNFGNKEYIESICFVSGGGWSALLEAKQKWYDVFLVWEMAHYKMTEAKELWQTILLWWHYETEKIGPKLLAHHLNKKFWVEVVFLDDKY